MKKSYFLIHAGLLEISWPPEISESILWEQLSWKHRLEEMMGGKIEQIRLGFHTLSISFKHPVMIREWDDVFEQLLLTEPDISFPESNCWKIPVCYDPEMGCDLSFVAEAHRLSESEVVTLHTSPTYLLHFYGFLPGFMYLGGLDQKLHTSRKKSPDRLIKAGSVAIGGKQTGIYPGESPGGWHVIGRSPVGFFNVNNIPPVVPQVGDKIMFNSISSAEFFELEKERDNYKWIND